MRSCPHKLYKLSWSRIAGGRDKVDTYESMKNLAESGLLLKVLRHECGVVPMPYASQIVQL
ncbi:MAG: hypothetical protein IPF67_19360 [Saprospiraceae bacterium]|nr:hypothetical protein [Candidatus Brachybacter algidus]